MAALGVTQVIATHLGISISRERLQMTTTHRRLRQGQQRQVQPRIIDGTVIITVGAPAAEVMTTPLAIHTATATTAVDEVAGKAIRKVGSRSVVSSILMSGTMTLNHHVAVVPIAVGRIAIKPAAATLTVKVVVITINRPRVVAAALVVEPTGAVVPNLVDTSRHHIKRVATSTPPTVGVGHLATTTNAVAQAATLPPTTINETTRTTTPTLYTERTSSREQQHHDHHQNEIKDKISK